MIQQLVKRGRDAAELDLASGELAAAETLVLEGADEVVAVVLSGEVEVPGLGPAGGRSDPFGSPGHAVYAPPGEALSLTAGAGGASVAVVSAAPNGDSSPGGPARIIGPDHQSIATVGTGNWERTVRTMIGPDDPASRLLVGETLNPPGNWSSYPPHKHDEHRPPDEVRLEEIYYFKVAPEGGFGVQLRYGPEGEESFMVREGDVAVIGSGYHPVVAAPGYQLYYLWALAGEGRDMAPWFDPRHAWVQG